MSFGYNVNTSAEHGQLEDNYSERHSGPSPGSVSDLSGIDRKTMPDFSRRQSDSSQPLRLPSIQLPSHIDFNKRQNQSRFSTCPSLHQHQQGKEATSTTETMLRKFFARSDDMTISSFHLGASTDSRQSDGVHALRNQGPQTSGSHFHRSSISHSHQTLKPNGGHSEAHEQYFMASAAPNTYSSHVGSSTRTEEPKHVESRIRQDRLQPESSITPKASLTESSSDSVVFEEGEIDPAELYRCRDCNRKCKSKASYLKHRSMMCTHRLGALTLECRYCKRHYTYAGYLQRHELECAKTNLL